MAEPTADGTDAYSEFGPVEFASLPKIQRLGGEILARNWMQIPHVTHQDEADITDLVARLGDVRHSSPSFLSICIRAVVQALIEFPRFNASLTADAKSIVLKNYFHIGIAIDTPRGLVVGVVRDCDRKSAMELTSEVASLAAKARKTGLTYREMTGGSFTLSSLGSTGGIGFTPIINAPEVAILGLSRQIERATRRRDGGLEWRLMLPLSLSYDHRVLNGADAAKFSTRLRELLANAAQFADEG
jgi:pyruvate dehydrogenase E2 component (dihydrolipoamide acetyltransferase)